VPGVEPLGTVVAVDVLEPDASALGAASSTSDDISADPAPVPCDSGTTYSFQMTGTSPRKSMLATPTTRSSSTATSIVVSRMPRSIASRDHQVSRPCAM